MPEHLIELNNGEKVKLNTTISLGQMKKFKETGILSKNFIGKLTVLESDPRNFEEEDLENVVYMAYANAYRHPRYKQDEFENLIQYDLAFAGQLLSEMMSGNTKKHELQKEFVAKTNKDKKGGKKHPK